MQTLVTWNKLSLIVYDDNVNYVKKPNKQESHESGLHLEEKYMGIFDKPLVHSHLRYHLDVTLVK